MSESVERNDAPKQKLLDDFLTPAQIKEEFDWGDRTLRRREADGLPVIILGLTRLYPVDKVRAWILSRVRERQAPERGRPRKAA